MLVREVREVKRQKVQQWWRRMAQYVRICYHLSEHDAGDLSRLDDIALYIQNLEAHIHAIEAMPYPREATQLRKTLLAFITNMTTALQHARLGNNDDRNVIFDITMVNKNMLEFHLEEFRLSLSNR